jgi:hypothetical protein
LINLPGNLHSLQLQILSVNVYMLVPSMLLRTLSVSVSVNFVIGLFCRIIFHLLPFLSFSPSFFIFSSSQMELPVVLVKHIKIL